MDPKEAHREEILEAMIEASMKGDRESFDAFNTEWARIAGASNVAEVLFEDEPASYDAEGVCEHCGEQWTFRGILFGEPIPGLGAALHVASQCTNGDDCRCFSMKPTVGRPFGQSICQECGGLDEDGCVCPGEPHWGSCARQEAMERNWG